MKGKILVGVAVAALAFVISGCEVDNNVPAGPTNTVVHEKDTTTVPVAVPGPSTHTETNTNTTIDPAGGATKSTTTTTTG